jgi:glycosyltransferase involved in cell wall biosynthesis
MVSIVIPIFNRHQYADRAVQSVIDQTYENWELFIIDDNSDTPYKLPEFCSNAKQKIILLRNEYNLGPGLSRQKGLDLALGEFVCFLDSDDYWKTNFLFESLKAHTDYPEICASYCQSEMTDGTLRRRNELNDAVDDIFYGVVSGVRPWATCSIMWKKKYVVKWNHIRTNQDALFELESSCNNPVIKFIPKVLCVIDKNTGANADNLVSKLNGNLNHTKVLLYAVKLIKKYNGQHRAEIKRATWNALKMQLSKMLRSFQIIISIRIVLMLLSKLLWKINTRA